MITIFDRANAPLALRLGLFLGMALGGGCTTSFDPSGPDQGFVDLAAAVDLAAPVDLAGPSADLGSTGADAGGSSNEPAGLTRITETSLTTLDEDGWSPFYSISSAMDPAAPRSAPKIAQVVYPAGVAGGDSPGLLERDLGGTATTMYVSFWMKLSSNWWGHQTGVNKIFHFWINGINRFFLLADGGNTEALRPSVGLQQIANMGGSATIDANLVPSAQVIRGQWQHWEVVAHANTAGNADGYIDIWLDGVKVAHVAGIAFTSGANTWEFVKFDPTWGGLGDSVPADQSMSIDHVYISGN